MALRKQSEPEARFNELRADQSPVLGVCHLGFLPGARKRIIVRGPVADGERVSLITPDGKKRVLDFLPPATYHFGAARIAEFSNVNTPGVYQATFRSEQSVLFPVGNDVWTQALAVLAGYQGQQRCGPMTNRPGRPTCHLDDARRRDTGGRVDTSGGWHDAGDLRKWTDATLMDLFGLLAMNRNLQQFPSAGPLRQGAILAEARYGNAYFLKMQDSDGLVWADVAGGVNGDNSDNHWTDNVTGTSDDRWINVDKRPGIQAMFITAQAQMSQAFGQLDTNYAALCRNAAVRCSTGSKKTGSNTLDLAWWVMAAVEICRISQEHAYREELIRLAEQLVRTQFATPVIPRSSLHGFFPMWPGNLQPLRDPVHSALPAYALLKASAMIATDPHRDQALSKRWGDAARLYLDGYLLPMAARSAYSIIPFGLFWQAPSTERYRPEGGDYTYRFFMPTKAARTWAGLNSHLLSHSLLLLEASITFADSRYRDLAFSQLEWVFGANPFAASLATGLGFRQPVPFSPFVGAINGGIMNGICGDDEDRPILDAQNAADWHCNEYWSPHIGYCQSILSLLAAQFGLRSRVLT